MYNGNFEVASLVYIRSYKNNNLTANNYYDYYQLDSLGLFYHQYHLNIAFFYKS